MRMFARSWFALLLFFNYLLVVGGGFMAAPGEPRYSVDRQEEHRVHCAHCHSLDIAPFLEEMNAQLATDAESGHQATEHQISLMDVHCLPQTLAQPATGSFAFAGRNLVSAYRQKTALGVTAGIDAPPWRG